MNGVAPEPDIPTPAPKKEPARFIVALGASAGGLEALERFFDKMPPDTGVAFVVIQHLSPNFKSLMDELLARKTRIPIHRVEHNMEVLADAIYLIPPKKEMVISEGRLQLYDKEQGQHISLPIDRFFHSLAEQFQDRSIGIILSGTGSDGARGVRDIRSAGGLVLVQAPSSAKFDGMPNSAVQTGAVDMVLTPEEMPGALLKYIHHPAGLLIRPTNDQEPVEGLEAIYRLLRQKFGIDFSQYKLSTVKRRIDRRMLLQECNDLDAYIFQLEQDSAELNELYKDLLIGVTRFFRDPAAFTKLQTEVLPQLLREHQGDEFRVWVAGCATGEEAYSLGMLIHECQDQLQKKVPVKIFATDVHRSSIEFASSGIYAAGQLMDVEPQRLERHFTRRMEHYQVGHELRQMVVFAQHNLLKDAPFTKVDLVTCRNVLIYFQPPAQRRILTMFHYAIKPNGLLFLGPSESPGDISGEFAVLDEHWKIYRKTRDVQLPHEMQGPVSLPFISLAPRASAQRTLASSLTQQQLITAYDTLLEQFMPPSILLNENQEVLHVFGDVSRFLTVRKGRLSTQIQEMIVPELRVMLNGALHRISVDKSPVVYKGLRVDQNGSSLVVNMTVRALQNDRQSSGQILVILEADNTLASRLPKATEFNVSDASRDQLENLEVELRYTKDNLQSTIEEMEASNEELQATNEELIASNEELQSTNEELHSVNEELYTVNAEYQKKINELIELTADMDNLLRSTEVHTLFLDNKMCIRKFTPNIAETFHLLDQDVGRRIDSFTHSINHPTLVEDIRQVMESGKMHELEVTDQRGHHFLMRILPYRSGNQIDGAVLTLIDISNIKTIEANARAVDQKLSGILLYSPHLVTIKDRQGRYQLTDKNFERIVRTNPIGRTSEELLPTETARLLNLADHRVLEDGVTIENEVIIPLEDGPHTYLAVKFPVHDERGRIVAVGGVKTDVTRLKKAERQATEAVVQRDRFLAMLSHELRNPLGAMVNAVNVLHNSTAQSPPWQEALGVLGRQAEQMKRLLDDLLDVARITQEKMTLSLEVVRMNQIVEETLQGMQFFAEQSGVKLHIDLETKPCYLRGDRTRLQQMIANLIHNALKYTPRGGDIWLELKYDEPLQEIAITVRDNGSGIQPFMLEQIFDLFVQADDSLERSSGGLGVGLTMVRAIAKLHQGDVYAFSEGTSQGSVFTIKLPALPASIAEQLIVSRPALSPLNNNTLLSEGVLAIIEDNDDSRRMMEMMLQLQGYRTVSASDGQSGMELIHQTRPRIAFIDIGLPKLNGFELARQLKNQPETAFLPLIAITGYGRTEDQQAARQAGFDEHLVKPLQRQELDRILSKYLDSSNNHHPH
jgi:two-component system, chemotaxis family, CheB/CheR fusion protein